MGYSTEFKGALEIFPSLSQEQTAQVSSFCEARHCTVEDTNRTDPASPSFWCDWATDGLSLYWNGSEKSYSMFEWLEILNEKFFKPWGCELEGQITAQGDDRDDVWAIRCRRGQPPQKLKGHMKFEET